MTGFITPLLMPSWGKFPLRRSSLYGKILGLVGFRRKDCHQVIQPILSMHFNDFSVELGTDHYYFIGGGGGGLPFS